jgi:hypothetical protein
MKYYLLCLSLVFVSIAAKAQKLELSLNAGSALSYYTGVSATDNSTIFQSYQSADQNYTGNPYGKKYAWGYGGYIQAQMVNKNGFIAGVSAGYETLKSKVNINSVAPALYTVVLAGYLPYVDYYGPFTYSAEGAVTLQTSFINLSPYIGYRYSLKKVSFDVMPGADIAFMTQNKESGSAVGYGTTYTTNYKRDNMIARDIRLKIGLNINYQRFTINSSYARGLTNYDKNISPAAGTFSVYSELFRFGVGYRIL